MRYFPLAVVTAMLSAGLAARADTLIFKLGPTNQYTIRGAGDGPAQGVLAGTTTTISSFAFYLNTPVAESLNFFITNGAGTSVLYSGVENVGSTSKFSWVTSNPLSFTLDAGSEYFFGILGNGPATDVGFLFPLEAYSADGLTANSGGNANTTGTFSNPGPLRLDAGATEIGLRLYQTTATTPEPSSIALLGTGVLGLAGVLRKRLA